MSSFREFRELRPYRRLIDMPEQDVKKLAARMYQLLFWGNVGYDEPGIDYGDPRYRQISEELAALQAAESRLVDAGDIIFPDLF